MSDQIQVSKSALANLAKGYNDAASGFTKMGFGLQSKQLDPSFGLVLQLVKGDYDSAKENTLDYLSSLGSLMSTMSQDITDAIAAYTEGDQKNSDSIQDLLNKIENLEQQNRQLSDKVGELEEKVGELEQGQTSGGTGGYSGGGTGGYSGGGSGGGSGYSAGGSGGAASAPSMPDHQMPSRPAYQQDASGNYRNDAPVDVDSDMAGDIGGSLDPDTNATDIPDIPTPPSHDGTTIPKPERVDTTESVDIDMDGDGVVDYSVNADLDSTGVRFNDDGTVTLSKNGGSFGADSAQTSGISFDTDNDGANDVHLELKDGQDASVRVVPGAEGSGTRYVQVDTDGDGVYESSYAVRDGAAASGDAGSGVSDGASAATGTTAEDSYRTEVSKGEEQAWQTLAETDPLHRSVDELKELFNRREEIELPETNSLSDGVWGGAPANGSITITFGGSKGVTA